MAAKPPATRTPGTNSRSPAASAAKGYKNPLVSPPSTGPVKTVAAAPQAFKPKAKQASQGAGMRKGGC